MFVFYIAFIYFLISCKCVSLFALCNIICSCSMFCKLLKLQKEILRLLVQGFKYILCVFIVTYNQSSNTVISTYICNKLLLFFVKICVLKCFNFWQTGYFFNIFCRCRLLWVLYTILCHYYNIKHIKNCATAIGVMNNTFFKLV